MSEDTAFQEAQRYLSSLARIEPLAEDPAQYQLRAKTAIPITPALGPILQQMPALFATAKIGELGGAYRCVMPAGVNAQLLSHTANPELAGTFMSSYTITGQPGIAGHAGFEKLAHNPALVQAPLVAFVVLSAVTGQYFQAKIEKNLRKLNENVQKVIHFFLADKESEIGSLYHFTRHLERNFDAIFGNRMLRAASLTNIQRNNICLFSLIQFYEKAVAARVEDMRTTSHEIKTAKLMTSGEIDDLKSEIHDISSYLQRRQVCTDLYLLGEAYEIRMAGMTDASYLTNLRDSILRLKSENDALMNSVLDIYSHVIDIPEVKKSAKIESGQLEQDRRAFEAHRAHVNATVDELAAALTSLVEMQKRDVEFVCDGRNLYLQS